MLLRSPPTMSRRRALCRAARPKGAPFGPGKRRFELLHLRDLRYTDVASASAAADGEPFDVLVSDLGLSDGDGYEIMRRIRVIRSMPGIAMSGYGMNEDRRRSHEAGFSEHLVKPIDLPQLIAAIRRVTDNRGPPIRLRSSCGPNSSQKRPFNIV
jgi:CheY-like chemotaxis protein